MEYAKKKLTDLPHLDREIIKGIPWAEEMWEILVEGVNKVFLRWCQIVLSIGENEDVLEGWVKIFIDTYEDTGCELVLDMENLQGKVVETIEKLLEKTKRLCKDLKIDMPVFGSEQLSLCQEQQQLKRRVEEYEKLVEVRRQELCKLREKQSYLCNNLGKEPKVLKDSPLPSADEIDEFQKHIERLEAEKFTRLEKFFSIKEELTAIIEELKISPSSQFEKNVFSEDDSAFLVTDNNMKQLEHLQKNLYKQLKNAKEEIAHLRNKIDDYWNLLDFDLKEREEFRQKHKGNSVDVLEALRIEVKRCEEVKKANIKVFVDKLRGELNQLWDKCHCSQTAKREFGFFNSDCYNEDLLELHETELKKWKKYYEENKELLTLLEKHKCLWNKLVKLEENAGSAKDRYNNRGGQLLKEEKERNKLSKQIPQIEENLIYLAERYNQRYGTVFTNFGETIQEYICNLHEDRENAKKEKLSARKLLREQSTVVTPAKSVLNLFPSSSQQTPLSTTKRKLPTPMTNDKKKPKTVLSERRNNKVMRTPIPTIKITTSSRSKRLSTERKKRIEKIRRRSSQKSKTGSNINETFCAEYGDFQNELSTRIDCRSTILPTQESPSTTQVLATALGCKTPTNALPVTPYTPGRKTPTNVRTTPRAPVRTPRTPVNEDNKLSRAKSTLKLIF